MGFLDIFVNLVQSDNGLVKKKSETGTVDSLTKYKFFPIYVLIFFYACAQSRKKKPLYCVMSDRLSTFNNADSNGGFAVKVGTRDV